MARTTERLTALKVARAKPGLHHDGRGLYLQVTEGGRSWVLRYTINRRARWMGLGSAHDLTLAMARERATEARLLKLNGTDPIEQRRAEREARRLAGAKTMTFRQCAEKYIASHENGWRNDVHRKQWPASLAQHVYPVIGDLPVHDIDTALVMKVVEPIWTRVPETASRVRGRIESILDWARVRGFRAGENPAHWRGHLDKMLPARSKVRSVRHHPALHYDQMPAFMAALREQNAIVARAMEFLVLTGARVGEVLGARQSEFSLLDKVWTVPAERMKASKAHRVPLSPRALAILPEMQAHCGGDDAYVFPGSKGGRPLHRRTLLRLVQRLGRNDVTVHGFRRTFRDWAGERTAFPFEVLEKALAHTVGSKSSRSYARSDLLDERRKLMSMWAEFCTTKPVERDKVVPMQRRG